jgi:hypothetical protein
MRACCRQTYEMAREQAASLADADAIRDMTAPPRASAQQAVVDLLKAQSTATLREVDQAISPDVPISVKHRQTIVCHARAVLAREGKYISSIYGVGYRLEDERRRLPRSTPLNPVQIRAVPR